MDSDLIWSNRFNRDIQFGYVGSPTEGPGHYNPRLVLNQDGRTVEHALVEELERGGDFTFSVAFISAGAIAQLKQHLRDHKGSGRIVTSDFLGFNDPRAFAELLNLKKLLGIDVRRHTAEGFHPKGYVFERPRSVTAMIGSSNLTNRALSQNHEWNLKVSAATGSDLANQLISLLDEQIAASEPLTQEWIDEYSATYVAPPRRHSGKPATPEGLPFPSFIEPNIMQQDALLALDFARAQGAERAIVISATGTGKTMLSALDVRSVNPRRMLFVVHREQILDRTIREYRRVLGGPANDYGLLTGSSKQSDRRFVFATIQTLSQEATLASFTDDAFDYIIIDEAHRAGASTYQRVIERFRPRFLLGMTATPERTDGFNVFELFDYNVPYEIRLSKALEAEMLCPFHYYGISDIVYDDEVTTTDETPLQLLISPERVGHLIQALDLYGQAGVAPRGLIFCSRVEEARMLSEELNKQSLRGQPLRTIALTGEDSIEAREQGVAQLESGQLDYILTVDVFNEGVDIPTLNQVIMLRQTQSAIVFVQQLGRGLRLAEGKDYLTVIDFIGNYTNNFLIPIALFGDDSLNRESLRERLNEAVEAGALPGLSSVSFDEISRERILNSIKQTQLDSMSNLKNALVAMRNRVGEVPKLWDFYRFHSVDPVLLATKKQHYPALVQSLLREDSGLTPSESRALDLLSHEVLAAKRMHEFALLELLLSQGAATEAEIREAFEAVQLPVDSSRIATAIDTLTLTGYAQADVKRYQAGIAERIGDTLRLTDEFSTAYAESAALCDAVGDLLKTGKQLILDRYQTDLPFTPGMQYSRRDAARIVGWPRAFASTIYGYKTDEASGVCTIFVTLHKSSEVDASTAYEDQLLDPSTMRWFSRSRRTLESREVSLVVDGLVEVHVFVKKDDAEGSDHYYLGRATAHEAQETTMPGGDRQPLPVVKMLLKFRQPIKQGLYDYFHPLQLD
ncbi:MAG: DEAD/DEAH box helicase [Actinobacteria bacterium]|nr:DEAD/DEAH box helicase [Actinomycetota bacterium]